MTMKTLYQADYVEIWFAHAANDMGNGELAQSQKVKFFTHLIRGLCPLT